VATESARVPAAEATFDTIAIDGYYEDNGTLDEWTVPRVNSLCRMLNCTVHELGKLCAVDFKQMNAYIAQNQFPPPVRLHMAMIEGLLLTRAAGRQTIVMPLHLLRGRLKSHQ
jgi:hypothetical protein